MIFRTREEARDYINAHPEVVFDRAKQDIQGRPSYICPVCGNGSGQHGTGITSRDGIHWKCFGSCGFYGDVIDWIGKVNNEDNPGKMFDLAYGLYDIQIEGTTEEPQRNTRSSDEAVKRTQEEPKKKTDPLQMRAYTEKSKGGDTSYLQARGLSLETIEKLGYGYDAEKKAVVIPTTYNNQVTGYTLRFINVPEQGEGMRYRNEGKWGIFNEPALYGDKPVFITEGAIDAGSIEEVGGTAISINSANNADNFLRYVKENKITAPYFLISLDNDNAGSSATQKIEQGLKAQNIPCSVFFIDINAHDINQALQRQKTALQRKVQETLDNIDTRTPEQIDIDNHKVKAILPVFRQYVIDERNNRPIPTGFKGFDTCIGGGLLPRFYIIGAVTTIGKTTLVLQMADNIAKAGNDVIIFSLEMAKEDIIARSISRHTYEICTRERLDTKFAKTEYGILMGGRYKDYSQEEKDLIADAYREYSEYAEEHISIYEGKRTSEEIRDIVQKYIEVTGKRPVVIVDYLQILTPVPELIRATEKQQIDHDIDIFTAMRRELKVPVIGISSFNRGSYLQTADISSFKESGNIEYSGDTVITLELDVTKSRKGEVSADDFIEALRKNPRDIKLTFQKNRGNQVGTPLYFQYNPKFNYFEEDWTKSDTV